MPFANTETGTLHYEVTDLVAPWVEQPGTIIFHHGIGGSAGMWAEWLPHLIDRHGAAPMRRIAADYLPGMDGRLLLRGSAAR